MKFTLSWLREHLDTSASLDEITDTLTRIGLEVEGVDNRADALAPFTVARVLTAQAHPQADKLRLLSVDTGAGAPVQVVCGAPNARAGLVGVFGGPGAYVPGSDLTLAVVTIRGVQSHGMMCSARELQLGDDHAGIIELPADAPVGVPYARYAGLDDPVIDVAITPNRGDAMSVHGIARDLAAAGLGSMRRGTSDHEALSLGLAPDVRTDDPAGCPAFYAQIVRGVTNGPSPAWLQQRLRAIGQRPISVLVDITNYIMIGWGRPLHVYDLTKVHGPLVVRKAHAGENLVALNGKTYVLDETMTVIADDVAVHDIGGIMGGMHSGVSETTTDVLIECAYFDPETIARTGQTLALTSDARSRFERGVDPAFLEDGLALATGLVLGLAGGTASAPTLAGSPQCGRPSFVYDPERVTALAGVAVAEAKQRRVLTALGFEVIGDAMWQVRAPSWRSDIGGTADIVEEVIRIVGLDHIPSTPLPRAPGIARPTATPAQRVERRVRRTAASRGLHEAVTWSFIGEAEAVAFGGSEWTLANPISTEMKAMRPSLLPGLVAAARRNRLRGEASVRLFEVGRRYLPAGEAPTAGVVLAGQKAPRTWQNGRAAAFDAHDSKAEVLALLEAAGAPVGSLQLLEGAAGHYHPARSGRLCLGPRTVLAEFGELHPATLRGLDTDGPLMGAEVFLDALPRARNVEVRRAEYRPPLQQPVLRDFAFVIGTDVRADVLVRAVRSADKAAIADVRVFDRFTGAGIDEGEQSLGVEVTLQPVERSFTDTELNALSVRIIAAAEKIGARLRD